MYISKKAVIEKDGKFYVYYKTPEGEMELKEVEVGIDNGINIEILSGLEEGDTIYLASRVSSENAVMSNDSETNGDVPENRPGGMGADWPDGAAGMEGIPGEEFEGGTMPGGGIPGGGGRPEGGGIRGEDGMPGGGGMPGGSGTAGRGGIPN